jgi:hypothetical protein
MVSGNLFALLFNHMYLQSIAYRNEADRLIIISYKEALRLQPSRYFFPSIGVDCCELSKSESNCDKMSVKQRKTFNNDVCGVGKARFNRSETSTDFDLDEVREKTYKIFRF